MVDIRYLCAAKLLKVALDRLSSSDACLSDEEHPGWREKLAEAALEHARDAVLAKLGSERGFDEAVGHGLREALDSSRELTSGGATTLAKVSAQIDARLAAAPMGRLVEQAEVFFAELERLGVDVQELTSRMGRAARTTRRGRDFYAQRERVIASEKARAHEASMAMGFGQETAHDFAGDGASCGRCGGPRVSLLHYEVSKPVLLAQKLEKVHERVFGPHATSLESRVAALEREYVTRFNEAMRPLQAQILALQNEVHELRQRQLALERR